MQSSMRLAFVLIFVAFPLLEIALLIKAGETIGFWPTITLLVAAAALGFVVIREQGLSMVGSVFTAVNEGRLPFEPMLDSYVVIMAGFLLIIPGFISDVIGLLLLVPPLRRWSLNWAVPGLFTGPGGASETTGGRKPSRPIVIEGTYRRLDQDDEKSKNGD
jgi:UPF0716 protein FxsA